MFLFFYNPDCCDSLVADEVNQLSPQELYELLHTNATDNRLVFTWPSRDDRTKPEVRFTAPYVLEKICKTVPPRGNQDAL